jgi:hypothetical protein
MPTRSLSTVLRAVEDSVRVRGLFTGDALERAKQRLVGLLDASVIVRSPETNEDGSRKYIEVPDNAIRLAAAVKLIELETGRAPQFLDIKTSAPGSGSQQAEDPIRLLMANPALAEKLFASFVACTKARKESQRADRQEFKLVETESPTEFQSEGRHWGATTS